MERTLLPVVLAAILLLAGCNGLVGDAGPRTPDATSTPTPEPVAYPPGVTDDGVRDALELVESHQRATANASYVSNNTIRVEYPNGTATRRSRTVRHDAERDRYAVAQQSNGPRNRLVSRTTVEVWANDTVAVGVWTHDEERTYFSLGENFARQADRSRLLAVFTKVETTTTGTTRDGRPLVHLLGTGSDENQIGGDIVQNVSGVSFSAAVTPAGVVRSYTLRYEGTVEGRDVRVVEAFQLRRSEDVTVGRPTWLSAALNETEADESRS